MNGEKIKTGWLRNNNGIRSALQTRTRIRMKCGRELGGTKKSPYE